jgi:phage I-like protein
MKRSVTALLSTALALTAGPDVQLVPAGEFAGRDGRPGNGKAWKLNDAQGAALAARLNERHGGGQAKFNFDYQHQTILTTQNGQPAPASGWAQSFEWRPGQGLYALSVDWTARAKQMIDASEYRYISPVIKFDEASGTVTDVLNAALTNYPNLMQLEQLAGTGTVAQLQALNAQIFSTETSDMQLLAALVASLGLADNTTEAQAIDAVKALKVKADTPPQKVTALSAEIVTALGLAAGADDAAALSAVAALKAKTAAGGDTATATIAALQGEVAALTAKITGNEVTTIVDQALKDGKLLPAQKDWALSLGKANIAQLSAFIKDAPVVAAGLGTTQTQGKDPGAGGEGAATANELAICSAMGLSPEEFKKGAVA